MFFNLYKDSINVDILRNAVYRTSKKRNSLNEMSDWEDILNDIKIDPALRSLWDNYCENNKYASGVSYEKIMDALEQVAKLIDFNNR